MAKTLLRAVSVTVSYAIVALAAYVTLSLGLTAIGRKLADSPACHSETYEFFDCCGAMTIYVVIVGPALIAGAFLYVILRLRRVRFVRAFSEVSLLASLFLGMVLLISFDPNLRGLALAVPAIIGIAIALGTGVALLSALGGIVFRNWRAFNAQRPAGVIADGASMFESILLAWGGVTLGGVHRLLRDKYGAGSLLLIRGVHHNWVCFTPWTWPIHARARRLTGPGAPSERVACAYAISGDTQAPVV